MKMKFKLLGALGAVSLLAACAGPKAAPVVQATASGASTGVSMVTPTIAPASEAYLVANIGDRVYFALNKYNLSPEAQQTLSRQAAWLQKYPGINILIAGNCDDRGTQQYNLALGWRRANAVRNFLIAKGVSPSRVTTISYGKDRPVALGDNPQAWAQNRNAITSVIGFNPQAGGAQQGQAAN